MSKVLFKATSVVSAMTFVSRILGFVRDMLAAQFFGATASVDAFYVAFKIPNFMRSLFAEGSFSQAFVPVLSEYRYHGSEAEVRTFISHLSGVLGLVLLAITLLGIMGAPVLVKIFAPGLDEFRFIMATDMLRITFPYLMFISLTALVGGILNSYNAFGIPAFTPALLNICLIAAIFFIGPYLPEPVVGQAWGVLIAGIVQFAFQLPFLYRLGFLVKPRVNWRDVGVQKVLKLMVPALFGASVGQISLLLNTIFASFLAVGSVTWLYYSDRLAYFPLGVFGVALATVVLPQLSRQHSARSVEEFSHTLDWGIRCNLLIGIPAAVTMCILSGPLIVSLFQYGKFNAFDVLMTQRSVLAYALGLQAFMLVKVLSAAFYARQDIKSPVRYAVITLIVNMLLNVLFIKPLAHAGLALASSCAFWFNVLLLLYGLHQRGIYRFQSGWRSFLSRLLMANFLLALFLWWSKGNLIAWLNWHWQQRFLHLLFIGAAAIGIYVAGLIASGIRLRDFKMHSPVART